MNTPHKCLKKISVMPICVADLHIQNILYLFFIFFILYLMSLQNLVFNPSNQIGNSILLKAFH